MPSEAPATESRSPRERAGEAPSRFRVFAQRVREGRFLMLVIFVNLVVILGAATVWYAIGGDPVVPGAALAGAVTFLCAMVARIRASLFQPATLLVLPAAILFVGGAALVVRAVVEGQPRDLTTAARLSGNAAMADGDTATLALRAAGGGTLHLTLQAADHDPAQPTCLPGSTLRVVPAAGGHQEPQRAAPGRALDIRLAPGANELDVELSAERGCELDVRVAEATLDD